MIEILINVLFCLKQLTHANRISLFLTFLRDTFQINAHKDRAKVASKAEKVDSTKVEIEVASIKAETRVDSTKVVASINSTKIVHLKRVAK